MEAQLRAKRLLGMVRRGELAVPPNVEKRALWLISGGAHGIKQKVDPGQAGYEIVIDRFLAERLKRVKDEKPPNGRNSPPHPT